jgi:hypothetical protein
VTAGPKTLELEQRLARLEICCRDMQSLLELVVKRSTALQAEVDHISAKLRR